MGQPHIQIRHPLVLSPLQMSNGRCFFSPHVCGLHLKSRSPRSMVPGLSTMFLSCVHFSRDSRASNHFLACNLKLIAYVFNYLRQWQVVYCNEWILYNSYLVDGRPPPPAVWQWVQASCFFDDKAVGTCTLLPLSSPPLLLRRWELWWQGPSLSRAYVFVLSCHDH